MLEVKSPPTNSLAVQKAGSFYTISELKGDAFKVSRLQELGFIRGEKVYLKSRIIFGEPLVVEIRDTLIALRISEAECIWVTND